MKQIKLRWAQKVKKKNPKPIFTCQNLDLSEKFHQVKQRHKIYASKNWSGK